MASLRTGKQRSVSADRFAMVPRPSVPRSAFDMPTAHKTTFDAGWLVPIYVNEVLPGDSVRLKMTAFCRLATAITPVMDNLIFESFFFFVPNRLVWDRWAQFMGEQADPDDSTVFLVPQKNITDTDLEEDFGSIYDYFGITLNSGTPIGLNIDVSALPLRAYNLIWNAWFRDEDLQDPVPVDLSDGPDVTAFTLLRRGKRFDYFTSCRPWPQKPINAQEIQGGSTGTPMVPGQGMLLPQSGAPVTGIGIGALDTHNAGPLNRRESGGRAVVWETGDYAAPRVRAHDATGTIAFPDVRVMINDLRTADAVQRLMEQRARGGTRYTELVRLAFGVTSPDARLQRPEYLGGGRAPVVISPIAQTSASGQTGSTTVLGELAGVGTAVAHGHGFSQSFTEHGHIIGLVNVRADLTYQNGINRMWFRRTQFDFYWPALAHLGEQPVLQREIFVDAALPSDLVKVFGYQERWSEYKNQPNRLSGRFRSNATNTLDSWHFAQEFDDTVALTESFIVDNPPVDRVLQVGGLLMEQFLFDSVIEQRWTRCMPMYSIPGFGARL